MDGKLKFWFWFAVALLAILILLNAAAGTFYIGTKL